MAERARRAGGGVTVLAIVASVLVACLVVFAWSAATAPLGWQDDEGFHPGPRPEQRFAAREAVK